MAQTPLDIVTVDQAKAALRQAGDDPALEHEIISYVRGAAAWIERVCNIGLVDTTVARRIALQSEDAPIYVAHRSHQVFDLWTRDLIADAAPWIEQSAAIAAPHKPRETVFYAPTAGWPSTRLEIQYTISTPANRIPATLRSAMLLMVRDMFDMKPDIQPPTWAVRQMIQPYVDMALASDLSLVRDAFPIVHDLTPVAPGAKRLRAAWGADAAFTSADLLAGSSSTSNIIEAPSGLNGQMYLAIWRSDVAGGDPSKIILSGRDQRSVWGNAMALDAGAAGQVVVSAHTLNAALLGGEDLEVR